MTATINYTIRRAVPDDYPAYHKLFMGEKVIWGTLQVPYPSIERWRKVLSDPTEGTFELVACVDDEIVGQLFLNTYPAKPRRRHAGSIGMAVRDDWQGKGAGSALMQAAVELADRWLNLSRLELEVFVDNEAALRLYRKYGFVVEGTMIRYAYRDGHFVDVHAMARLRPE